MIEQNLTLDSITRDACKITRYEYQLELQKDPCLAKNIKYKGEVIATYTDEGTGFLDQVVCQDKCDSEPKETCQYWTWKLNVRKDGLRKTECHLLQDKASQKNKIGWISGSKGCIASKDIGLAGDHTAPNPSTTIDAETA